MYPADYRYSKEHEWIVVKDGIGTIGITDHAQNELGDVVFVELPAVGRKLGAHETFGTIESVKAVSDLFCPVAGEVVEVNVAVTEDPALVNRDPHQGAWLIRLRLANAAELDALLPADRYQAYIAGHK